MSLSENIGQFYLGQSTDNTSTPLLYDAKDLATHAVIIGMTGSGKTGLGICLLEEALLDHIPVIAIDPKGDMGNLLLSFPYLTDDNFAPYIDPIEAEQQGKSTNELAADKAALWRKGLADWGITEARIRTMRSRADFNLYTPGATFGRPISLLSSLKAPNKSLRLDKDLYRERIAAATTSILTLLSIENDPLSRENILINQILEHFWDQAQKVSLESLILAIQTPPFERIGVMDIETIYPQKDRLKLAMKLNALLSSPNFSAWTQGESLDTSSLLFKDGKPQLSIMNIAHLDDNERMFFVTMILNDILSWMRTQSGTGTLRAILYIDELFGYMPPTANPASKVILLTLLKQARAYGLGVVLSTQNPVDLDYKGLSNTGTWFIGKLQTKQDRERVMSGLLSATESGLNKSALDDQFNLLGKRSFLMHNIHEAEPVIFKTRWAMSYLAGPLTRSQIERLSQPIADKKAKPQITVSHEIKAKKNKDLSIVTHVSIPSDIPQYTLPISQVITDSAQLVYASRLIALCQLNYQDRKLSQSIQETVLFTTEFSKSAVPIDWRDAIVQHIDIEFIDKGAPENASFILPITAAMRKTHYKDWEKSLLQRIRQCRPIEVFYYASAKIASLAEEDENSFRQRLTLTLHEMRDQKVATLREKLSAKLNTLEDKLIKAQQRVDKESEQASGKNIDALIGVGSAILGAFLGRKTVSKTNARSLGTAMRKVNRAFDERNDIQRAKQSLTLVQDDIRELEFKLQDEIKQIHNEYNIDKIKLDSIKIYPKVSDITIQIFGLGWQPGILLDDKWRKV